MKPSTEEFLYLLLWANDHFLHPSRRTIHESFEAWAYRRGFLRRLRELELQKLVERGDIDTPTRPRERSCQRVHRLTEAGRIEALGGRDPQACWNRPWDGRWRLIVYDIPERLEALRMNLRRHLHQRGFGRLQFSVWITPHPVDALRQDVRGVPAEVGSMLFMEAMPAAGETDAQIVAAAWDFPRIDRRYAKYLEFLQQPPSSHPSDGGRHVGLREWAKAEREAWHAATALDPFLPLALLPPGYRGLEAWRRRLEVLSRHRADFQTLLRKGPEADRKNVPAGTKIRS